MHSFLHPLPTLDSGEQHSAKDNTLIDLVDNSSGERAGRPVATFLRPGGSNASLGASATGSTASYGYGSLGSGKGSEQPFSVHQSAQYQNAGLAAPGSPVDLAATEDFVARTTKDTSAPQTESSAGGDTITNNHYGSSTARLSEPSGVEPGDAYPTGNFAEPAQPVLSDQDVLHGLATGFRRGLNSVGVQS